MDLMTAVKTCFSKYADFNGRAQRSELWWFVLFNFIVSLLLTAVLGEWLGSVYSLAVFLPSIAVGARRLHDIGRSGWWQLIALIPVIGLIVLIYWFVQPGRPGTNEHGPNPLPA
ncbi:MAG: DUF805 domain-containing protein [Pararhodobacter sp.]|nr:DUF805 domain-containing protein [Pararhodobacter sp.]